MDEFTEANMLLNSALEELEHVIKDNGNHRIAAFRKMEEEDLDNGNARDADDERSTKGWKNHEWDSRRDLGSEGSSGVESPPSDIPTSSSSFCANPKVFHDFVRAIDDHSITERPDLETQLKIMQWMNGQTSSSPSMSTVSCPEYPELQDKLHRLIMARDSLSLQVSVLSEQVSAQKEKIRDLETLLALKKNNLYTTEQLLQKRNVHSGSDNDLESKRMDLLSEMSSLKLKYATLEREKSDTERKLKTSQNEMNTLNQSMQGMVNQHNIVSHQPTTVDEMEQLKSTVQRLLMDNEQKTHQINSLRNALDEQMRTRNYNSDEIYSNSRWNEQTNDVNQQIRRLLMDDNPETMSHSTSFPVGLSSSSLYRTTVQPSSSYTSSLSTVSPQHGWSQPEPSVRHAYHPPMSIRNDAMNYRSPSSPAARQLAAELDQLRRMGDFQQQLQPNYSSASLPRGMGKSNLTGLPPKKSSLVPGSSAGELSATASVSSRRSYREHLNNWISNKIRRNHKAQSVPNLVESDDEIARGKSERYSNLKPLKRDRTRSSLRNLFSKLTRSTSQDAHTFRRGSSSKLSASTRVSSTMSGGLVPGAIPVKPPLSHFVDWRREQLSDWMAEIGFTQYVPQVAMHVRSGRHLLNMNTNEYDSVLHIRNPLHRKRMKILLNNIENDSETLSAKWDLHATLKWLEDIGMPQYKEIFSDNMIDGDLLLSLTAADMINMRITSACHYMAIARSIQHLKINNFDPRCCQSRYEQTEAVACADKVVNWSHAATCEWLRTIDLAEFTPNLFCAGTPGALMVYEPTFTAETLAEILQIPAQKTLLRRHLTSHFNQLLGQKIIADKREHLVSSVELSPQQKIKLVKKGFSLSKKKNKQEVCLDPEQLVGAMDFSSTNGPSSSGDSKQVHNL